MWRYLALLPVLVAQGLWVAARAARLPEAEGPRHGVAGAGPPLRVLILGDSSAAGVGVGTQADALSGRIVAALQARHEVEWRLVARSGATVASLRRLVGQERGAFDVAVIAVGVNDVKNGVQVSRWQMGYAALIEEARARFGVRLIVVSGVPPLGAFPILPEPLAGALGARATWFDAVLRERAADDPGLVHIPFEGAMDPAKLASDGFHPGAAFYAEWGARVAEVILAHLPR